VGWLSSKGKNDRLKKDAPNHSNDCPVIKIPDNFPEVFKFLDFFNPTELNRTQLMKPTILTLLAAAALSLPAVAGEKLALLKLTDGTEYKAVEIMGVSAKGLRILHHSGAANVAVDSLPVELKAKYTEPWKKAVEEAAAKAETDKSKPAPELPKPMPNSPAKAAPGPGAPPAPNQAPAAAPLPQLVGGKVYGIAEVLAQKFKFDGKIVKMDVLVNYASKIEQISNDECQIFVGDPFTKLDSDYAFLRFPEEGRKKIETMLSGARGRMTLYIQVEAEEPIPLKAIGRTTVSGSPGTPITVKW